MAPRAKPKKKTTPIANGDNQTNNSPVTVKKSARGRKAVVEEKNAEAATSNGGFEQATPADAKAEPKVAFTAKNVSPSKNKPKVAKQAQQKSAIAKKTKAAVKEHDIVVASTEQIVEENVGSAAGKARAKVAKKAAKPKIVAKPKGRAADEPSSEDNVKESAVPDNSKVKQKAPKKAPEPKVVVKPAPKVEKKTKTSAEISSPSTSSVATTKGRKKRENVKVIEAIEESPKVKRGKKQTVITVNHEAIDAKVNATKRTAFSKKSKNMAEENGNAAEEVIPVESVASKRKKAQPKAAAAAELPIVIVAEKVTNKRKPAVKAPVKGQSEAEEDEEEVEVVPKKSRKKASVVDAKTKAKNAAGGEKSKMNATETEYEKIDFTSDKDFNMKICSFNVAGLRAFVAKGGHKYFEHEQPNIICLQEIKCTQDEVPAEAKLKNYHPYWFSKPGGRGGVAILSKTLAHHVEYGLGDEEMDYEGRIITAEFEKFYLICVYVPNAGQKLVTLPRRLRWNKLFENHLEKLEKIKPVIICGDMNVAHTEIDLANPKTNTKNAGFTQEERDGMSDLLGLGFTDAFRYLHPSVKQAYTFWSYRGNARIKNVGWRLDYFITSARLIPSIVDCFMRPEVLGSDHCPINLLLNI